MKGKTIRIYLGDGVPTGILQAEIINWTGKVIVAPRTQLAELAIRDEAKRTGTYCLVGPDPSNPSIDRVYIGEGDNVLSRLTAHDKDESKDFWTRCVVVISKDENLTKSHVRYLESRLIQMAYEAGRCTLVNSTTPPGNPLPEPDVADMEFFLGEVQMVLPVLGFPFLQPKPKHAELTGAADTEAPQFETKEVGTEAYAVEIGDEFVVLKGSTARKQGVESWTSYKSLRDELVAAGKLVHSGNADYLVFTEDVAFSSPSAAASVIAGRNTNGRLHWRVKDSGRTYGDWQEEKMAEAERKAHTASVEA